MQNRRECHREAGTRWTASPICLHDQPDEDFAPYSSATCMILASRLAEAAAESGADRARTRSAISVVVGDPGAGKLPLGPYPRSADPTPRACTLRPPPPRHLACPQSIQVRKPLQVGAMAQIDPKRSFAFVHFQPAVILPSPHLRQND
jgi:hypothetical protein